MVEVEEGLPVGWLVGVCVGVLLSVVFSRVTESLDVIMLGSCQFERLPYLVPVYQIVVKFCLRYRRSLTILCVVVPEALIVSQGNPNCPQGLG